MSKSALCFVASLHALLATAPALACDGLVVDEAWVREPPPGAEVAAGYVRLTNRGAAPLAIDAVTSPCCGHVMIHRTEQHGDSLRMVHVDRLALAPGEAVTLAPGGAHLMLMGLAAPLTAGNGVRFSFACGGHATEVRFPVRADAP
ncbi:MAG: copper chaperone PCu(A)C [Gammaproteobacteria bacterium]|nr:copper chaperone PCu(A)C [Gammaproteobacteria bacterium]MBI5617026.1 copper chaperone PCu(A)C [Gammaproteobacteria bacterium]